jgi:hypothetical protein
MVSLYLRVWSPCLAVHRQLPLSASERSAVVSDQQGLYTQSSTCEKHTGETKSALDNRLETEQPRDKSLTEILAHLPLTEAMFYILLSLAPGKRHGYAILKAWKPSAAERSA